jgi:hypothetical protein
VRSDGGRRFGATLAYASEQQRRRGRHYLGRVGIRLRSLAVPLLASAVIFVKEGIEFDAVLIGIALWGIFVALSVASGGAIVGLSYVVARLRRRPLTRPSRSLVACAFLASLSVLFPVPAAWDTVEGPDSAGGLTAALDAALLNADLKNQPTLSYTEECCG